MAVIGREAPRRVTRIVATCVVGLPLGGCAGENAMPMEPELVLSDPPAGGTDAGGKMSGC